MNTNTERTAYIDFLRAIAILIMLLANISPYFFNANTPIVVRIMYSMAAPTFIFLAGYSASEFSQAKNLFPFWRVLFMAAFIDVCIWRLLPFHSFDVLYIIAITILSVHLLKKISIFFLPIIFLLTFVVWDILSAVLPYEFDYSQKHFSFTHSFKRLLFDGWFPILPWIFIGWAGMCFAQFKWINRSITKWIGLAFLLFGIYFVYAHQLNPAREGYLEIFYPASVGFICLSLGLITTALTVFNKWKNVISHNNLLCVIGRNSLFAYMTHCAIIAYGVVQLNIEKSAFSMLLVWGCMAVLIFLLCYAREYYLPKSSELPKWFRYLSGF